MRVLRLSDYVICLHTRCGWACADEAKGEVEEFSDLGEALRWYFGEDYVAHREGRDGIVVETKYGVVKLSNVL